MTTRLVARCPSCGGRLDTGTSDIWTCERVYCGDEWEPHLADWRLSPSQADALRRLAVYEWVHEGPPAANDNYHTARTLEALGRADLATPTGHGPWRATSFGLTAAEALGFPISHEVRVAVVKHEPRPEEERLVVNDQVRWT